MPGSGPNGTLHYTHVPIIDTAHLDADAISSIPSVPQCIRTAARVVSSDCAAAPVAPYPQATAISTTSSSALVRWMQLYWKCADYDRMPGNHLAGCAALGCSGGALRHVVYTNHLIAIESGRAGLPQTKWGMCHHCGGVRCGLLCSRIGGGDIWRKMESSVEAAPSRRLEGKILASEAYASRDASTTLTRHCVQAILYKATDQLLPAA
ncbi:hypothetical protein DFP72DRAFT_840739 [Ephemerocybe angulata]|uniref:Uncharacterized protein n=1 Tax=Ephemerocybe angulata TaxID=980116 RepID=A0A8H6IDP7_9AGAR|nr:hypothetical protein DFP72DRAFT_840739 [Tulosesus angulatus]